MKPKIIPHPDLPNAKKLSILELNNVRFTGKRTVITPEKLEAAKPDCAEEAPNPADARTTVADESVSTLASHASPVASSSVTPAMASPVASAETAVSPAPSKSASVEVTPT